VSGAGERRRKKLAALHRRQNGLCALCGGPLKLADADLDHIVPRSLGGMSARSNLQATHRRCNSAKGATFVGDPLSFGDLRRLPLPPPAFIQAAKPAKHGRRGQRGEGVNYCPDHPVNPL
jgi:hypothetical protein